METIGERISQIISHNCESKAEFARILGEKPNTISNWIARGVGATIAKRITTAFHDVNLAWLLTGEGPMLKTKTEPTDNQTITKIKPNFNQDETKTEPINILNDKAVPCYESTEGSCGIITMYNDFKEVPTYYIDFPPFNDCDAYITVYGDSMFPQYCAGELIAIKKINNYDAILWGEAHLVVTNSNANDLRTVKLLFQSDDESKLVLRASNPSFKGDTVISKADILNIFIVKGKIKRNQI